MEDGDETGPPDESFSLSAFFGQYRPAPSQKAAAAATGETDRAKLWPFIPSVIPADIDYDHFGMRPLLLGVLLGSFKIDNSEKVRALVATYDLTKQYLAPFMAKTAVDMLPDLVSAVARNPQARIVFVGRDAFSLGYVTQALAPDFYTAHCRAMYLSRSIVDAALRELEETDGRSFAAIEHFRKRPSTATSPSPAWHALAQYFADNDIHLDRDGSEVHLIDTGYKGSVQEMLSAAYPRTRFFGHYVFFGASPHDPHPGSKKGYALHLDTDRSGGGLAVRGRMPDDPNLTFSHHEAIIVVEELLQGSQLSPTSISPVGKPLTLRQRHTPRPLDGLNPALIAPEYTDPFLREGVLSLNVVAVSQYGHDLAQTIGSPELDWTTPHTNAEWYAELAHYAAALRDQVRAWVGRQDTDPALSHCLDSFIHRVDKDLIAQLDATLTEAGLSPDEQRPIWQAARELTDLDGMRRFVDRPISDILTSVRQATDLD